MKLTNLAAVRQAKWHYDHKAEYTREDKVNAAIELAEWKLFSNSQITVFTGLETHKVGRYTLKTDRTGGRLDGGALAPIIELFGIQARGEISASAICAALDAGASVGMLVRLLGLSATSVRRYAKAVAA